MKHFVLFTLLFSVVYVNGQHRVYPPQHLLDQAVQMEAPQSPTWNEDIPVKDIALTSVTEEEIGDTQYDNQSNASIPKKIVLFDDGTIGATWTRSMEPGSFFADRGTGYNYFDGLTWGEWPTSRVEDIKIHRPVYARWGENGEILISYVSGEGLYMATCAEKGTGDWDFESISGPPDEDYILWPRAVTSQTDYSGIHLLSLTLPPSHGGTPYEGLNGALLYSYSSDGGGSWEIEMEILDGMTSDDFYGFGGDTYAFAEPVGDVVAFVFGEPGNGLYLMKSTDGGLNFERTTIWETPYPGVQAGMATDTFYCADGSHSLAIDDDGMVHVAFGITRIQGVENDIPYQFLWVDGIAYWNEDMPAFSNDINALSPYGHPDSELIEDYNLIGWTQDFNNNGELDFLDDMGRYSIGLSSQPQLVIDGEFIFLVYSSVTETFSNGLKNYRHIWSRAGHFSGGNTTWSPNFKHLTSDLSHVFDECVYPAVAANSDDYIHLIYQVDTEPGIASWYQQHDYIDNQITYVRESKETIVGIGQQAEPGPGLKVAQNYPNPFHATTQILTETTTAGSLGIKVFNPAGQVIYEEVRPQVQPGKHLFDINGLQFTEGIYFYTVSDGKASVTKKMIVD